MNKTIQETGEYAREFREKVKDSEQSAFCIFPPALVAYQLVEGFKSTQVSWGGQNCYFKDSGAFTGENSPALLSEMGASYCLVGHSERRHVFLEPDEFMGQKVKALQDCGVTPVLCVGETIDDRKWGRTNDVITRQLKSGLSQVDFSKPVFVAYEPVWAIGTGEVATIEQVAEVHNHLRDILMELSQDSGPSTPILYGGSVKAANCAGLAKLKEVNGFLVGGASLKVDDLLDIYRNSVG